MGFGNEGDVQNTLMPITVELIKEGRAVLQTYSDPLETVQMYDLRKKMDTEILPSATGKMHIIADFRKVSNLPGSILMTGHSWLNRSHPNTGTIIGVVNGGFVQAMAEVFSHLGSKRIFMVTTSMEDALKKLEGLLTTQEISHPQA